MRRMTGIELKRRARGRGAARHRWASRVVAGLATFGLLGALCAAPAFAGTPRHQEGYYLSLGDSLAFGYQPNLVGQGDTNPADYRSYAEYYTAITPRLRLVNYGCPGESTATFLRGGCPWLEASPPGPLHNSYGTAPSQMAAAQAFLAAHRGQVSLVSLDVGNNDLLALVATCERDPSTLPTCLQTGLPAVVTTMSMNISAILRTVHQLAPGARIVLFNLYNPLALQLPTSDALIAVVNTALAGVAAANGAQVADAFGAINIRAGSPVEGPSICLLTWECSSYRNIHPTTLGYVALTYALARAAR